MAASAASLVPGSLAVGPCVSIKTVWEGEEKFDAVDEDEILSFARSGGSLFCQVVEEGFWLVCASNVCKLESRAGGFCSNRCETKKKNLALLMKTNY